MKKSFFSVVILCLFFCISVSLSAQQANYAKEARAHEFEYYFSGISGEKNFDNLDSAYAYINEALAKMNQVSGKSRAKGGGGILEGPSLRNSNVRVIYSMRAFGTDGSNALTSSTTDIPGELRKNIGVFLVFHIFTAEKSVCYPSYYLKSGYVFNSNSKQETFTINGNRYVATYQSNWTVKKVFDYLKG